MLGDLKYKIRQKAQETRARVASGPLGKKWNQLSSEKRKRIAQIIFYSLTALALTYFVTYRAKHAPDSVQSQDDHLQVKLDYDPSLIEEAPMEVLGRRVAANRKEIEGVSFRLKSLEEAIREGFSNLQEILEDMPSRGPVAFVQQPSRPGNETKSDTISPPANKVVGEPGATVQERRLYTRKITRELPRPQPGHGQKGQPGVGAQQGGAGSPGQSRDQRGAQPVLIAASYTPIPTNKGAQKKKDGLDPRFAVPPGSFVKIRLLTGVYAPTGLKAKSRPQPVLAMVVDRAFLPNRARMNYRGCLLMGEAFGELASERVYVKFTTLSCVDGQDVVHRGAFTGYMVDSDGKIGLRGQVKSRRGLFLARQLTASFIEGIARGFRTSVSTVSVTPLGGTIENTSGSDALRIAMGEGVGRAFEELAKAYRDMAKETFPVVEVGAGRSGFLVLIQDGEVQPAWTLAQGAKKN